MPILDIDIDILFQDKNLVVIDKPASIPVHPCGRYRKNTCTWILETEYESGKLNVVHRLDRLTSGVVIFSRNRDTSNLFQEKMQGAKITKVYLAMCVGKFSSEPVVVAEKISILDHKDGTRKVSDEGDDSGKESKTHFCLVEYDEKSDTSLIICRPITGRTHQIRVHLQSLGHPIPNDPVYGPKAKEFEAKGIKFDGDDVIIQHVEESDEQKSKRVKREDFDENCPDCKNAAIEFDPEDLYICLHAWKYNTGDYAFESKIPGWCKVSKDVLDKKLAEFHSDIPVK